MRSPLFKTFLALVAILVIPMTSNAATLVGADVLELGGAEIVVDNLYIGAGDLSVGGVIEGDLIAGGGTLVISGAVRDDVLAAGGNVTLLSPVDGDVRIAGGNLLMNSQIGGDLIALGGTVKTLDTTSIGKDLVVAGGNVMLSGTTTGDAFIVGATITLNGTIEGDVEVEVGEKLVLGKNASIGGDLIYRGSNEAALTVSEGAVITGNTRFEQTIRHTYDERDVQKGLVAFLGTLFLLKLLALAVTAVVLVFLFKRFSRTVVSTALESFWLQALRGFIVLVMVPVAAIVLFATLFGFHLGLLLLSIYAILLILTCVYSGILFGSLIVKVLKKEKEISISWWRAVLGVILLGIIKLIPVVGWIVAFFFWLATLGTFFQLAKEKVWRQR